MSKPHIFKLQNITKHKLMIIKQLTVALTEAQAHGWNTASIEAEITKTKFEAMHPELVIRSILDSVAA